MTMLDVPKHSGGTVSATTLLADRLQRRLDASSAYFGASARSIAACAAAMADRFFAGGTLLVMGTGPHAVDAQHNAVEYVHPVLPGCRALPAVSLSSDAATVTGLLTGDDPDNVFAGQLRALGRAGDIALAFDHLPPGDAVTRGLAAARNMDLLSVALLDGSGDADAVIADHVLQVRCDDAVVARELHLATYHILWELVHIVLNHRGIPAEAAP